MKPQVGMLGSVLLTLAATGASAQEQGLPPGAKSMVLILVFRVEDFGAKTEDFKVTETDVEVHIELAVDVLFEFDKATLQPKAEGTSQKRRRSFVTGRRRSLASKVTRTAREMMPTTSGCRSAEPSLCVSGSSVTASAA